MDETKYHKKEITAKNLKINTGDPRRRTDMGEEKNIHNKADLNKDYNTLRKKEK